MNSKYRLVRAIGLFGEALVFAADAISIQADGLTFDAAGNLFVWTGVLSRSSRSMDSGTRYLPLAKLPFVICYSRSAAALLSVWMQR